MPVSQLLSKERSLTFQPRLATIAGVNEAIFLQQLQYWIRFYETDAKPEEREKHFHDGDCWIYNTYEQWQVQFPFWSTRTIQRIILSLEEQGVLVSANFNRSNIDQTKWYRIDHEALDDLDAKKDAPPNTTSWHHGRANLARPLRQVGTMYIGTGTTTETTTEITNTAKQSTAGPLDVKPPPRNKPIVVTREWQAKAEEIEQKLQAKPQQRTTILKLCKDKPRPVIDAALTFAIDYPNAHDKTMIFIKRVHALA